MERTPRTADILPFPPIGDDEPLSFKRSDNIRAVHPLPVDLNDSLAEQAEADEAARLAGGIILGFIVGMFAGALLLAVAAWAVDTIRGWFL